MRKLTSILIAVMTAAMLPFNAYASGGETYASDINGSTAILYDLDDSLDESDETAAFSAISEAVEETGFNICVVITDDVEGYDDIDETIEYSDSYYKELCGADSDGILLLVNNDTYFNWISAHGEANDVYMSVASEMLANMSDGLVNEDFLSVVQVFCSDVIEYKENYTPITAETDTDTDSVIGDEEIDYSMCVPEDGIYTIPVGENYALLHDLDNSLTEDEESELLDNIIEAANTIDSSVAIVITDDIGFDKSDYGVMDFADVYYENYCGINTDGILLLLNNDTKYDWISTSGDCIDTYEYAIDYIFDDIWDYVLEAEYVNAVEGFCSSVIYYGKVYTSDYNNDYSNNYSYEFSYDNYDDIYLEDIFGIFIFASFIIVIALIIFAGIINSGYRLNKNKSVSNYVLKDSLAFSQKSDTYLRTYTTRTRINSSSGSSGSRRSGGSHRSSGGGRHGGGGRRR